MTRSWRRLCGASSLVGAGLLLGCHGGHRQCDCGAASVEAHPAAVVTTYRPMTQAPAVMQNEVPAIATPKAAETTVEQASFVKATGDDDHGKLRRRSFADITADPCFAHAADYTSLTGELYYVKAEGCWTVRFASVDDDDRYGGKVALTGVGPMDEFHSGQMVRVEGHIAAGGSQESSPKFEVQSIRLVR